MKSWGLFLDLSFFLSLFCVLIDFLMVLLLRRSLVYLVQNSKNPLILSICCHDIGEFVRFHPRGRAVASSLGVKQAIMVLMENQDPDVQKHALLCTQKLLVVNWDQMPRFR